MTPSKDDRAALQDETISVAAREACKWVGWAKVHPHIAVQKLVELKSLIETVTGKELEEYT